MRSALAVCRSPEDTCSGWGNLYETHRDYTSGRLQDLSITQRDPTGRNISHGAAPVGLGLRIYESAQAQNNKISR